MAPAARWSPLLLLLLLLAAATATATTTAAEHEQSSESDSDPTPTPSPTPWPERFHAVLFTNLTNYSDASTGPPLRITDLYYDWPRRRNLNLVRHQLSADPLYDVEWNNGTTFYFDSSACRVERFPVGVLPPWWLSGGGAQYLGRRVAGGIDCHVWGKAGFIFYYLTGIQQYVMSFEPGVELEDAQWQAPAYCFPDDDNDEAPCSAELISTAYQPWDSIFLSQQISHSRLISQKKNSLPNRGEEAKGNDNAASSSGEEAGDGLEAASRLLRKLAGAAAMS